MTPWPLQFWCNSLKCERNVCERLVKNPVMTFPNNKRISTGLLILMEWQPFKWGKLG